MRWLAFLPLGLFVSIALAGLAMSLLLERGERQRRLHHPPRWRKAFRPVVIAGGKMLPPSAAEVVSAAQDPRDTKSA